MSAVRSSHAGTRAGATRVRRGVAGVARWSRDISPGDRFPGGELDPLCAVRPVGAGESQGRPEVEDTQALSVRAAPSSAPSARSTEQEMQVKVGVSRSVYELDSVVLSRCTRSMKSAGLSVSNATTNS